MQTQSTKSEARLFRCEEITVPGLLDPGTYIVTVPSGGHIVFEVEGEPVNPKQIGTLVRDHGRVYLGSTMKVGGGGVDQ